jgi:hypothetical protein
MMLMDNKGLHADRNLKPEQERLVDQLTVNEVHEIDATLLSNVCDKWRKVAMVVARTMLDTPCRIDGIPDVYYSQRIRKLVGEKRLEARGNLLCMRYSEVRKPVVNDSEPYFYERTNSNLKKKT